MGFVDFSLFWGLFVSLFAYEMGCQIRKKWPWAVCNPLLIAIVLVVLFLQIWQIPYSEYKKSAEFAGYLLTPATICLAVPLYRHLPRLKKHAAAILCGVFGGVLASMGSVLGLSILLGLSHEEYVTLLPKSITTAIGMGLSAELGGVTAITVAVIIMTGILGNIMAESVCRMARIRHPVAKGIAIGTAAHAIGTAGAMEMGEVEGAMSGLAIAVSGLITVVCAGIFAGLY